MQEQNIKCFIDFCKFLVTENALKADLFIYNGGGKMKFRYDLSDVVDFLDDAQYNSVDFKDVELLTREEDSDYVLVSNRRLSEILTEAFEYLAGYSIFYPDAEAEYLADLINTFENFMEYQRKQKSFSLTDLDKEGSKITLVRMW